MENLLHYVNKKNIRRQFIVPCTSQQNEVAYLTNRTLSKKISVILRTSGLPNSFCTKVAKNTCYVVNWSPSTTIRLKTPMDMWTKKSANYSRLYTFGCPVYMMYNATKRTKLDPKYRRHIFLGYANGLKGYRMWDPTTYKIIISRDVIFVEDQLQRKDEDNNTVKEKSETISVYVENNP